jgi:hypothetical protein
MTQDERDAAFAIARAEALEHIERIRCMDMRPLFRRMMIIRSFARIIVASATTTSRRANVVSIPLPWIGPL